jgi:hypothetical protein
MFHDNEAPVTGGNSTPMFILRGAPAQGANKVVSLMSAHNGGQQGAARDGTWLESRRWRQRARGAPVAGMPWRLFSSRAEGLDNVRLAVATRECQPAADSWARGCSAGGWRRSMSGNKKRMWLWFLGCWTILGLLLGCSWVRVLGCH